ncbi:MAG TPA: LPS assembly protein LptD [Terracidiphilus sp.]
MRPRTFVFITMMVLCHWKVSGQVLTNALPPAQRPANTGESAADSSTTNSLPEDPGQEALPIAQPEPIPQNGLPVAYKADRQTWMGHVGTLYGVEEFHYRDYVLRADKVTYNQETSEVEAEGHLQMKGGPDDIVLTASHGDMRLNMHTARFYDATGTVGVRRAGRVVVYSTAQPFLFSARVLLQTGEGTYKIVDGTMTNCRLPKPDWQLLSRHIDIANGTASTTNTIFKLFGVPVFDLPYLRHPVDEGGRESGLLIPVISNGSSIRGYTFGEQVYWVLNRSTDMVVGMEYYSKRGWAPNGDFRFKGAGLDHLNARWNALIDRGYEQLQTSGPQAGQTIHVNQGGVDIVALGRMDFSPNTRLAGDVEYLSSYIYRLEFNDNFWQAVNSEVKSDVSLTHAHNGFIPSIHVARTQTFAGSTEGDEARILHLPSLRYDVLDQPLAGSPVYWGLGSSISHLGRAEPGFHAHNIGRLDAYPHLSLPIVAGGWSIIPEAAARLTFYSGSQSPDLTGANGGIPTVSHDPLRRMDGEVSLDIRPPALERDFKLGHSGRVMRHVIEPEILYHFVGGIGSAARNVLTVDTTDIATDTNEVGYRLTQRFYLKPGADQPCTDAANENGETCPAKPREWASWQIAQKVFLNSDFGGALIPDRRNVFDTTLDLSGIAFLTEPRTLAPITSRLRFEAIDNLRIQWDLDYDPKAGRFGADNLYAGYSWGATTVGIGHSLLNAVDEQGSAAAITQSQQVEPFLQIGKQSGSGFNLAANGSYDFVHGALQYAGVQAVYNWNCCGITMGYRRFALGSLRDETQYLYSFTLANFGSVGDIRRSNTVFRDATLPPPY